MLYGMEDYDEFSLTKKNKINIKKVMLIILVVLACAFLFSLLVSLFTNNEIKVSSIDSNGEENINNEEVIIIDDNNQEKKDTENNNTNRKSSIFGNSNEKKELADYIGNHIQIPVHSIEKLQTKFVPQFNENGYNEVRELYFSDEKQVYLTFDDGPSKNITPQILDILKEYEVKATFFVLGARVELYPDTVKREFEEGHYIANHGYSHKYSQIYESKDTVFQEYIDCENAIKKALNNQDYNSYLFRFPGGSSGGKYESVKYEARELFRSYGVAFTNWNCLTGDAEGNTTKEECIQEMIKTKGDQNSIVLLMHDANDKSQTVEALPEIIQYYKNEGYTFKTFYEIF